MTIKGFSKASTSFSVTFFTPAGGSKRRAEQQAYEDRLDEAMKGHRPLRLSSATLVRLLSAYKYPYARIKQYRRITGPRRPAQKNMSKELQISQRGIDMPASPIRKLAPCHTPQKTEA